MKRIKIVIEVDGLRHGYTFPLFVPLETMNEEKVNGMLESIMKICRDKFIILMKNNRMEGDKDDKHRAY